ncbi:hypothetical protein [Brevibacterium sediminis]
MDIQTIKHKYGDIEIAHGIRVRKQVSDMTREELETALYDTAEYASRTIAANRSLSNIIKTAINK